MAPSILPVSSSNWASLRTRCRRFARCFRLGASLWDHHPDTLKCARRLVGLLNRDNTVPDEAVQVMRLQLSDLVELRGEADVDTLTSMHSVGYLLLYRAKGSGPEFSEGVAVLRRALPLMHATLGAAASMTLDCTSNLGYAFMNAGNLADAEPLLEAAAAGLSQTLGESHDRTVAALRTLGTNLANQEKLERAEEVCWRVLRLRCATRKEPHNDTTEALTNLGAVLFHRSKWAVAAPVLRRALSAQAAMLGFMHPDTEKTRNEFIHVLAHLEI